MFEQEFIVSDRCINELTSAEVWFIIQHILNNEKYEGLFLDRQNWFAYYGEAYSIN